MATKLTKPIARAVVDLNGKPLTVTLTENGVEFRRPRSRTVFLLPYLDGETRAQCLASDGVGLATAKTKRSRNGNVTVSRGLLTT